MFAKKVFSNKFLIFASITVIVLILSSSISGLFLQSKFTGFDTNKITELKSSLLKNNVFAKSVINSQPINIDDSTLYSPPNAIYMASLPYNVLIGLHMIGYQYNGNPKSKQTIVDLLRRFKTKNNLPISTFIDKETLLKLDIQVYQKEKAIINYPAKAGTIFTKLPPTVTTTNISNNYTGWIFNHSWEILPTNLINNFTPENYFLCIYQQCVGSIKKINGDTYAFGEITAQYEQIYKQGDFVFTTDIFPVDDSGDTLYISKSLKQTSILMHEFAHYLDGTLYPSNEAMNRGIIDTAGFHTISFDLNKPSSNGFCFKRKSNDIKDFISRYPFHGANSVPCLEIGDEYGAPYEDFAESFTAYILAGKTFREATNNNTALGLKYAWLKKNVFVGREYNTELPYGLTYAYDGCSQASDNDPAGGPHYLSCDENFIWNGQIPYTQSPMLDGVVDIDAAVIKKPLKKINFSNNDYLKLQEEYLKR